MPPKAKGRSRNYPSYPGQSAALPPGDRELAGTDVRGDKGKKNPPQGKPTSAQPSRQMSPGVLVTDPGQVQSPGTTKSMVSVGSNFIPPAAVPPETEFPALTPEQRTQQEGIVYLSNFGSYYRVPRYTAAMVKEWQNNVYCGGVEHKQRNLLFQEKYEITITNPDGEEDDETEQIVKSLEDMLDEPEVSFWMAMQMAWRDLFYFGMSFWNPIWEWTDAQVGTKKAKEYRLTRFRHLPAESFGTQPYGRPFLYSDILQGVVLSPVTGEIEYFQTLYMPQLNYPPGPVVSTQYLQTQLVNIFSMKDPAIPDLAGKPTMLPILPLIVMLEFSWQAQIQKVNRIGAPLLFLKIENPVGDDVDYGQKLLQNWGKNTGFQLRHNFTLITPDLKDTSSALETIEALDKLIQQYFSPSSMLAKAQSGSQSIGGNAAAEAGLIAAYCRSIHSRMEVMWEQFLQPYLDENGYDGYHIHLTIPDPAEDRSAVMLQVATLGAQTKVLSRNEIREILASTGANIEELDDKGLQKITDDWQTANPVPPALAAAMAPDGSKAGNIDELKKGVGKPGNNLDQGKPNKAKVEGISQPAKGKGPTKEDVAALAHMMETNKIDPYKIVSVEDAKKVAKAFIQSTLGIKEEG